MTLTHSLDALVLEHDRIGSPLRDHLVPGIPGAEVDATVRALGVSPHADLIEFFAWHDIRDDPGEDSRVTWFWPASPYRLPGAVTAYRRSLEIDSQMPPEATLTGFWRPNWFPILYGSSEDYAVECPEEGVAGGMAPVWRVNWHPDPGFETVQVSTSLVAFIDRIVAFFRAGAYEWNAQYRAIMTVDEVFIRMGLGYTKRPW